MLTGDATATPASVGRFVVLHTIGAGGSGVVLAAYDPVLDRRIAVKLLRTGDTAGDARLLQEAQAMARLSHPNVVAVHEAGASDGRVYLAMEFVDGGTLRGWLASPRTWREIRDRFVEAGRGLAAAHDAGLVHRDFKPDNVLVGSDGRARVTDFGLVALAPVVAEGSGEQTSIAGTPRYMAPEQHAGQRADQRADQFAFCVALYEALWEVDPFAAPDPAARTARVLRGDVAIPPPGRVPTQLIAAVVRGLAVDPARRHPTMHALLDEILRVSGRVRRRRLRLIAAGFAGGGLTAVALAAMMQRTPPLPAPDDAARHDRFQHGIAMAWGTASSPPAPAQRALDTASLDRIARAGATATNLKFAWSAIEPVQGVRDWSYADHQVAEVERLGLEPFAYAGSSPAWAGRDPLSQCSEPHRNPPRSSRDGLSAFHDFFKALAARYCGRVKYYEFWSEPNGCAWLSCGCGDQTGDQKALYALWLDQWYQAMREGCSDVVLAIGGLDCSWGGDPSAPSPACGAFLDALYAADAGASFDAIALRPNGYRDPAGALRDDKALNWEALRQVSAVLRKHGHAGRMLWVNGWSVAAGDDASKARLITAALAGLRSFDNVFTAQYAAISDPPDGTAVGLASIAGPPDSPRLEPRAGWFAFRDSALGTGTAWHGPINPGMELQSEATRQFSRVPLWGPSGGWQYHTLFPRAGNAVLGRKFGFYSAGLEERFGQTLGDAFEARRRYCFRSYAQGGRDNTGLLPYQIGYIDTAGTFVVLNTRVVPVDARWRETTGVCHDVTAGAPEIGRSIAIRFGAKVDGGESDIWFDNLRVTSVGL